MSEVQQKLDATEVELAQAELEAAGLERDVRDLTAALETKTLERRDAERESANSGAALRQMESETARIERRLQEWALTSERNREARARKQELIAQRQQEAAAFEMEREGLEAQLAELQGQLEGLRVQREELQQASAEASAALAGLEERRRNAAANHEQTRRMAETQGTRIAQIEQQIESAGTEKLRREQETSELASQHETLAETRATALAEGARLTPMCSEGAAANRWPMLDAQLQHAGCGPRDHLEEASRTARQQPDGAVGLAKLASDIEHIEGDVYERILVRRLRRCARMRRLYASRARALTG